MNYKMRFFYLASFFFLCIPTIGANRKNFFRKRTHNGKYIIYKIIFPLNAKNFPISKSVLLGSLPKIRNKKISNEELMLIIQQIITNLGMGYDDIHIEEESNGEKITCTIKISKINDDEKKFFFLKTMKIPEILSMMNEKETKNKILLHNTFFNKTTISAMILLSNTLLQQTGQIMAKPQFKHKNNVGIIQDINHTLPKPSIFEVNVVFCKYNKKNELFFFRKAPSGLSISKIKESLMMWENNPIFLALSLFNDSMFLNSITPKESTYLKNYLISCGYFNGELVDIKYIISPENMTSATVYVYVGEKYRLVNLHVDTSALSKREQNILNRKFFSVINTLKKDKNILVNNYIPPELYNICDPVLPYAYNIRKAVRIGERGKNSCYVYFFIERDEAVRYVVDVHFTNNQIIKNPYRRCLTKPGDFLSLYKINHDVQMLSSLLQQQVQVEIQRTKNNKNDFIVYFQMPQKTEANFITKFLPQVSFEGGGLKFQKNLDLPIDFRNILYTFSFHFGIDNKSFLLEESYRLVKLGIACDLTDFFNQMIANLPIPDIKIVLQSEFAIIPFLFLTKNIDKYSTIDKINTSFSLQYNFNGLIQSLSLNTIFSSNKNDLVNNNFIFHLKNTQEGDLNFSINVQYGLAKSFFELFTLHDILKLQLTINNIFYPKLLNPIVTFKSEYLTKIFKFLILENDFHIGVNPSSIFFYKYSDEKMDITQYSSLFDKNSIQIWGFKTWNFIDSEVFSQNPLVRQQSNYSHLFIPFYLKHLFVLKKKFYKYKLLNTYKSEFFIGVFTNNIFYEDLKHTEKKSEYFFKSSGGIVLEVSINKGFVILKIILARPIKKYLNDMCETLDFNLFFNQQQNKSGEKRETYNTKLLASLHN